MGESVSKSGASVTVTSVTDVLCFGVGILSNMPVVQLFCLYTSIALTIDFLYQVEHCLLWLIILYNIADHLLLGDHSVLRTTTAEDCRRNSNTAGVI